jgi:hypothetical protein
MEERNKHAGVLGLKYLRHNKEYTKEFSHASHRLGLVEASPNNGAA